MVFRFSYPLILLLLPLLIFFIWFAKRKLSRIPKGKRRLFTILRSIIIMLLILSLAGFGIIKNSHITTTVFVVDSSDSALRSKDTIEDFIKDAIKSKSNKDKVAIVNFGGDTAVEFLPSQNVNFNSIQTKINGRFTNIDQGLKAATSLIPAGDKKRIVLISDGLENTGDSLKTAQTLLDQGIKLDVYLVANTEKTDVQVSKISVPETLRKNEKFEVSVKVGSNKKMGGKLRLYRDREIVKEVTVDIQKGDNNFVFSDTAQKGGIVTYTVEVEADEDSIGQNNKMSAFSYIEDKANVLFVQGPDMAADELSKIMGSDAKVTVTSPEELPVELEELQKYDGFVISDVSAEYLDDTFLESLEICIRHLGKGLLVTGGDDSYGPGGYHKTVLEKVLPVTMDIKSKEEDPNLGLVLIIDKSGSMTEGQFGISKLELAKEAAIRSTEVLKSKDMIGVIAFDDASKWAVNLKKLDNLKGVQDDIGTIRPGGGTSIIPALEEGYIALKDAKTKLKHIILLTDGQAERTGYEVLVEKINSSGITLSTVAVGRGADTELLRALAYGGNGRFYETDEFTDIPKIFAKETFLAGKTYLNDRRFTPKLSAYSPILNEINSIPSLDGYVGTTAKSTARTIFSSDVDEPVLATWQYGLGRTAAWTSDAKGMWTSDWMKWSQSPRFWKNLISWLLQKKVREDYTVNGGLVGGKGNIELKLGSDERYENETVEAVVIGPNGSEEKTTLEPVSPGVYKGNFSGDETGAYIANISINSNGESVKSISSGIIIPYSPEYDLVTKSNEDLLEKLSYKSQGRILKSGKEVFSGDTIPNVSVNDITHILLILAILLLMADIILRRLNIPFEKLEAFLGKAGAVFGRVRVVLERIPVKRIVKENTVRKKTDEVVENRVGDIGERVRVKDKKTDQIKKSDQIQSSDAQFSKLLEKKRGREK